MREQHEVFLDKDGRWGWAGRVKGTVWTRKYIKFWLAALRHSNNNGKQDTVYACLELKEKLKAKYTELWRGHELISFLSCTYECI